MATKKAKIQNNEDIVKNEEIKKENVVVDKKKKKTKSTTGTSNKTTTSKNKTAKKNPEKMIMNNKNEENTKKRKKTSSNKKSEEEKKESNSKEIKNSKEEIKEEKIKEIVEKANKITIEEKKIKNKINLEQQEKILKIEEIKKTLKNKKQLPKEEIEKINNILFKNIMIAIGIIVYFIFLNLGKMNIEHSVYTTDLKVFSMCTLLAAIIIIEIAYKKDSGEIALYGIEMIILAIATFSLIYINLMLSSRYLLISTAISFIFAIYYLIKSMVIYLRKRRQYFVNDIKEIMNKEEVE